MQRKSVSPGSGVYQDEQGRFWGRPVIRGRSTWRLLKAVAGQAGETKLGTALSTRRRKQRALRAARLQQSGTVIVE